MPNYKGVIQVADHELSELSTAARQLSAVRVLLERERRETEIDILLVTALEILRDGPKSTEQILEAHRNSWVGVEVPRERLVAALQAGESAGYVARTASLLGDGDDQWTTTGNGSADLERAGTWADDTVASFAHEVRRRASRVLGDITQEDAEALVDIIWAALCVGIKNGMTVFSGGVETAQGLTLTPSEFDSDAAQEYVYDHCGNRERADLLWALVEDALDQSVGFGNDLVSYVCVGYILHGFLARRDLIDAQATAGSLDGVRVIVETPWLLSVSGSPSGQKIFAEVVERSAACGVTVLVPDHTLDEFREVVERISREVRHYEKELRAEQINTEALLAIAGADNHLIRNWLESVRDTGEVSWDRFEAGVHEFMSSLEELGVEIRSHDTPGDERVDKAAELLAEELERANKGRGRENIIRDAKTVTMAWHRRAQGDRYRDGIWPTAWIVTRDTYMNRVYERLNPADSRAISLSPSQWLGILAVNAPAAEETWLAQATADYMTRQSSLRVAVQWPPEVILEMAKAVTADTGVTSTDVRMQQRSLDDLVREQPELLDDPKAAGHAFASNILSSRNSRTEKVLSQRDEALKKRVAETERTATAVRDTNRELTEALKDEIGKVAQRDRVLEQKEAEIQRVRIKGRRMTTAVAIFFIGIFASLALLNTGLLWVAGVTTISSVFFLYKAQAWWSDPDSSWLKLLWALVCETAGVIQLFVD